MRLFSATLAIAVISPSIVILSVVVPFFSLIRVVPVPFFGVIILFIIFCLFLAVLAVIPIRSTDFQVR